MNQLSFFFVVILPAVCPIGIGYDIVHGPIEALAIAIPGWAFSIMVSNAILLRQRDEYQAPGGPWRKDWRRPGSSSN